MLGEIWTMRCLPKPILIMICITQPLQKQYHLWTGKNLERKHQYRKSTHEIRYGSNTTFRGNLLRHNPHFLTWKVVTNSMCHLIAFLQSFIYSFSLKLKEYNFSLFSVDTSSKIKEISTFPFIILCCLNILHGLLL